MVQDAIDTGVYDHHQADFLRAMLAQPGERPVLQDVLRLPAMRRAEQDMDGLRKGGQLAADVISTLTEELHRVGRDK